MSSYYEKTTTLVGPTVFYKKNEESEFSLTINRSGILLTDGISEIHIEIGEEGESGNIPYTADVDSLSERETELIYEIAMYQYREFQRATYEE